MPADLEFTGERFVPGAPGIIAYEHGHRYAFALRHAAGRRVLDAACGEGYGTALLARVASSVVGIDVSAPAIDHARRRYGDQSNARFETAAVTSLPLADGSIDLVVSFETIEHITAEDQPRMLAEFARVLAPDGLLVLSSPNRRLYSEARDYRNPYHLHELDRAELSALLDGPFPARRWLHQVPWLGSALWSEQGGAAAEAWSASAEGVEPARAPEGVYFVVVAAKTVAALAEPAPWLSLYADREQSEWQRAEAAHAEVMRLDRLLGERDRALDNQTRHIRHLEELVAYRDRIVEERDRQLAQSHAAQAAAAVAAQSRADQRVAELRSALEEAKRHGEAQATENVRLERALAAQERIIAYRQSWRWWLQLPWVQMRTWWQQRGAGS